MSDKPQETAEQRRKRKLRDKVFGDVLPETTSDERSPGDAEETTDEWLRQQVPPHHG